jgi:hypothetical protein
MAGAVDLFSGGNSISGSNLFEVDKSPLNQLFSTFNDSIGQRDTLLETLETFIEGVIDKIVEFFENLTGLNINEGPILFFASVFTRLDELTGLDWSHGPIDFLISIVDAVVNTIEALTGLNINEGVGPFLTSLWANLENATGLNWDEGPIKFLISVVDAVVNAFETLTSLNINEGPIKFLESLWAALENATGLVWSEGPLAFLESAVTATINTIEALTGLNIDEGPTAFVASLGAALEAITGWDWTHGPVAFLTSVVTVTITTIENLTGLNIDEGPIKFFESLFTALEAATNLDWTHGPIPFLESVVRNVVATIEYLTGLNIDAGPEAFINSLFYELINGPAEAIGNMMIALDASGQGLAEKIGRAIIAVISGIPFVGGAIADTLENLLDGLVLWVRGGNQSGTNLINDPGAETAKFWEAVYPTNYPTVALRGTRKQPEVTRDTTVKRSAGASLRVTSGGLDPKSFYWNINDLGDIVPISTTVGDWFYAECYVFVPSTNTGSAAVTLVAEFRNSTNINTISTSTVTLGVVKSSGLTDPWQKIAGTFTVPSGYDRISFGFLLGASNTTTGDKFYVDDMMVREVTGTQNTLQGIHQAIRGGDGTSLVSLSAVGTALGGITDLTRGTSEAGSNLLVDPKASYPNLWIGTGLSTSTSVGTYKSASRSLVLTSGGSTARSFDWTVNDTGATTPIVAQPGDVFYCECYVLSPPGNGSATVTLHGKAKNSTSGATLILTPQLTATPVASGPWTKISGQYTIPSSGYDQFIAGITLGAGATTSGNKFYIDDMVVREVTGTQTTIDALGQAVNGGTATGADITNVRDAVASVFDLSRGNSQSGVNLLVDPGINYPKWWTKQVGVVTDTNVVRSANNSLKITSANPTERRFDFTVNDLGNVTPLVTRPGNVFYCEAWVRSPVGNANVTLKLHGAAIHTASGSRGTLTAESGSSVFATNPTQNQWIKVSGYFKIPETFENDNPLGMIVPQVFYIPDGFVAGITIESGLSTSGNSFYVDDLTIQDVTEAYKTNVKLYGAPQPATTITSTSTQGTGTINGIAQAVYGGTGTTYTIDDVKTAVGGVSDVASGYAQSGTNLLPDPRIDSTRLWKQSGLAVSTLFSNTTYTSTTTQSLQFTGNGSARLFYWPTGVLGNPYAIGSWPDKIYYVECYVYLPDANPNTTATVTMFAQSTILPFSYGTDIPLMTFTAAGTWQNATLTNPAKGGTGWTRMYGYFKMPTLRNGFTAGISFTAASTHKVYVDDLVITEVTEAVNTNNKLYGRPTPADAITTTSLPVGIPQAKVAGTVAGQTIFNDLQSISGAASGASQNSQAVVDNIARTVGGNASAVDQPASTVSTNFQSFFNKLYGATTPQNTVPQTKITELTGAFGGIKDALARNNRGTTPTTTLDYTTFFDTTTATTGFIQTAKTAAETAQTGNTNTWNGIKGIIDDGVAANPYPAGTDLANFWTAFRGQQQAIIAAQASIVSLAAKVNSVAGKKTAADDFERTGALTTAVGGVVLWAPTSTGSGGYTLSGGAAVWTPSGSADSTQIIRFLGADGGVYGHGVAATAAQRISAVLGSASASGSLGQFSAVDLYACMTTDRLNFVRARFDSNGSAIIGYSQGGVFTSLLNAVGGIPTGGTTISLEVGNPAYGAGSIRALVGTSVRVEATDTGYASRGWYTAGRGWGFGGLARGLLLGGQARPGSLFQWNAQDI